MNKAWLVPMAASALAGCSTNAGWGTPWGVAQTGEIRTNTVVQVETLVYSLRQNKQGLLR